MSDFQGFSGMTFSRNYNEFCGMSVYADGQNKLSKWTFYLIIPSSLASL